jgi:hypothetical protein
MSFVVWALWLCSVVWVLWHSLCGIRTLWHELCVWTLWHGMGFVAWTLWFELCVHALWGLLYAFCGVVLWGELWRFHFVYTFCGVHFVCSMGFALFLWTLGSLFYGLSFRGFALWHTNSLAFSLWGICAMWICFEVLKGERGQSSQSFKCG